MIIFDIGIVKVTYNKECTRVISVLAVDHPGVNDKSPRKIFREELINIIKNKEKVLLVRELVPGKYAPLTRVFIITIDGMDYLTSTLNKNAFDDLG